MLGRTGCRLQRLQMQHPSKVFQPVSRASVQSSVCNACRHLASPLRHLNLAPIRASSDRDECLSRLQQQVQARIEVDRAKILHGQRRRTAVFDGCCQKTAPPIRVDHLPRDETLHNIPTVPERAPPRLEDRRV